MRYVMKQKFFSFGDDFYIKDEHGRDVYFVDGKTFSFGDKLSILDLSGNELVFIKQKLMAWGPTYEVYMEGYLHAVVFKKLFSFKYRFIIDMPGTDDMEVTGNFLQNEYIFTRSGRQVAQVSKEWFSWTDTYGIDIIEAENDLIILACAVIIDMVCHGEEDD